MSAASMTPVDRFVDAFVRGVTVLSKACGAIAAASLAAGCLVVCHMVLVRYVFSQPTIWQTEFVTFAVVATTLLGSPYVLLTRGHVTVDLVPHYLTARPRRRLGAGRLGPRLGGLRGARLDRLAVFSRGLGIRLEDRVGLGTAAVDTPPDPARGPGHSHPAVHGGYSLPCHRAAPAPRRP